MGWIRNTPRWCVPIIETASPPPARRWPMPFDGKNMDNFQRKGELMRKQGRKEKMESRNGKIYPQNISMQKTYLFSM